MPTGYTEPVRSGEVTEFRDFAMQCARAFGALIMMRDEPSDAKIPEQFEPSTDYYDRELAEAQKTLIQIEGLTAAECQKRASEAHNQAVLAWEERREKRAGDRARYEAMLAKVRAWEPPSPDHVKFKEFMESQLTESIDFDCSDKWDDYPKFQDGDDWRAATIKEARRKVEYHKEERRKEIECTEGRNTWVSQLRQSLHS